MGIITASTEMTTREGRVMSYRTRIPAQPGKSCPSIHAGSDRKPSKPSGRAFRSSGAAHPSWSRAGRRRRTAALSAALAPARKAEDGSRKDTEHANPPQTE